MLKGPRGEIKKSPNQNKILYKSLNLSGILLIS